MRVVPGPDADLLPFPVSAWSGHIFFDTYGRATGKYLAHTRLYDAETGHMPGNDPVRRGINAYPYCDNDPVNYVDPTGEISNILGGVFGFAAGRIGSAREAFRRGFGSGAGHVVP